MLHLPALPPLYPDSFHGQSLPDTLQTPCFFGLMPGMNLQQILNRPFRLFIEAGCPQLLDAPLMRLIDDSPDFGICISSISAYQWPVARDVAAHMETKFRLSPAVAMNVRTCIQEAMINAIVHGNLGIEKEVATLEGMDQYYAAINERIAERAFAQKRVNIAAWRNEKGLTVALGDEGTGFPEAFHVAAEHLPNGRGLHIIHSLAQQVWIDYGRNYLCMNFAT